MAVKKSTQVAASFLARAYIAARGGDGRQAATYMLAACQTDELDPIMDGVAVSLGVTDDGSASDDDVDITTTSTDDTSSDDTSSSDDTDDSSSDDTSSDDSSSDDTDDSSSDDATTDPNAKVTVPASCLRLARLRF